MSRKRITNREEILERSVELLKEEGLKALTARNIANYMNISTQPIYVEFDSMDEVRKETIKLALTEVLNKLSEENPDDNKFETFCLNYLKFAENKPDLFLGLFMEDKEIYDYAYESIQEAYHESYQADKGHRTNQEEEDAMRLIFASIHGMAMLSAQNFDRFTREEVKEIITCLNV